VEADAEVAVTDLHVWQVEGHARPHGDGRREHDQIPARKNAKGKATE